MATLPLALVLVLIGTALIAAIAVGFSIGALAGHSVPGTFWLEVIKTAIGAFLGAGLAFASTLSIQLWIRFSDHVKAGNVGLSILVRQLNDFLSVKTAMLRQRATMLKVRPDCPLWLQLLPSAYDFTESRINPSDLGFLFDQHGTPTMQKVLRVQQLHTKLAALVAHHRDVRLETQKRAQEEKIKPYDTMSIEAVEEKIGPYLVAICASGTESLLAQFEADEPEYEAAFNMLRSELRRRFGKRFIDVGRSDAKGTAPQEAS